MHFPRCRIQVGHGKRVKDHGVQLDQNLVDVAEVEGVECRDEEWCGEDADVWRSARKLFGGRALRRN